MKIAGLMLAAGSSRRLGQPKQLLPFGGSTLLDASLDVLRTARVEPRLVTVGGAGEQVLEQVDLSDFDVVESLHHTIGCSSSIVSAMPKLADVDGFVLLLGDQPGVDRVVLDRVVEAAQDGHSIIVCSYRDGIGHPFYFAKDTFSALTDLHGDKAVWKVIESGEFAVFEVAIDDDVPLDVDTWEDYERLLASLEGSST